VKGDAIQFVRDYKHLSYRQAKVYLGEHCYQRMIDNVDNNDNNHSYDNNDNNHPQTLQPPSDTWAEQATACLQRYQDALWSTVGAKAMDWLRQRGLSADTIRQAGLGYNASDTYLGRQNWGLEPALSARGQPKNLWLPRGVVIPWLVAGDLWGLRIRRPVGEPKYYWIPGGTSNTLYNADALTPNRAAILLEGEIDALTVQQWAGDLVTAVATGSTHAARRLKWLARLSLASAVLVAYDADEAGEAAARYWVDALQNAKRWRPYWSDANALAQAGVDLQAWVTAGLPQSTS
jgi:DNA primase